MVTNWLLLILSLPAGNATARTRIWRTLKALGCGTLRDGVWLLPDRTGLESVMRHQAEEARSAGGSAWLLRLGEQGKSDDDLVALFDRGREYAALDLALATLVDADTEATIQKKTLRGLRRQFEQISAIDYFPGPARLACDARLADVARVVRERLASDEPSARDMEIQTLDARDYQGKTWATRRDLWVDRLACAWLIRRFIDPEACFLWLDHPEDCPSDALGFDFDGARFTHVGHRVSYQTLLASFGLENNVALTRIGAIVHSLDVGGTAAEAAGLEAMLKGLKVRVAQDDPLLAEGGRLLDDLYAAFAETHGEPT